MVERSLCMREARGSIPLTSIDFGLFEVICLGASKTDRRYGRAVKAMDY